MVELEEWLASQGRPKSDVRMLRIDELAELGCCCFCSILYIGNEKFIEENPDKWPYSCALSRRGLTICSPTQSKPERIMCTSSPSWVRS